MAAETSQAILTGYVNYAGAVSKRYIEVINMNNIFKMKITEGDEVIVKAKAEDPIKFKPVLDSVIKKMNGERCKR
jgi:hypothetical protein